MERLLDQIEQDQRRIVLVRPAHEVPEDHLVAEALVVDSASY